ncbi:hypothetical protein EIKCOROL_02111 [Eikenella corrodens ATCC 23834]|uniref:Uncharacterized protein n=1 Tax=Eikenella corrodens ATCC 23834 TaxID=546274 RepID=C0DXK0_EIKCO|nr:hypothetical protein EIKCOROL_02111 [Eikenella corrodens ATCC 23834]
MPTLFPFSGSLLKQYRGYLKRVGWLRLTVISQMAGVKLPYTNTPLA